MAPIAAPPPPPPPHHSKPAASPSPSPAHSRHNSALSTTTTTTTSSSALQEATAMLGSSPPLHLSLSFPSPSSFPPPPPGYTPAAAKTAPMMIASTRPAPGQGLSQSQSLKEGITPNDGGPSRFPQPMTVCDIHQIMEQEQESLVNRALRSHVTSPTSSTCSSVNDLTDPGLIHHHHHHAHHPHHRSPHNRALPSATRDRSHSNISSISLSGGVGGSISGIAPSRNGNGNGNANNDREREREKSREPSSVLSSSVPNSTTCTHLPANRPPAASISSIDAGIVGTPSPYTVDQGADQPPKLSMNTSNLRGMPTPSGGSGSGSVSSSNPAEQGKEREREGSSAVVSPGTTTTTTMLARQSSQPQHHAHSQAPSLSSPRRPSVGGTVNAGPGPATSVLSTNLVKSELDAVKRENEALRRRVRELEAIVRQVRIEKKSVAGNGEGSGNGRAGGEAEAS